MQNYRLPQIVADVETSGAPVRVDQWYDRSLRSWRTMLVTADGSQIGEAMYDGTRADAAASRSYLECELALEEWTQ